MKQLLTFVLMTFFCSIANAQAMDKQALSAAINSAGKQRMLSQKISKEILLIAKGIEVEENKENLKNSADLFNTILQGLSNGDPELGLAKTDNADILKQLNKINKLWVEFSKNITAVLAGDTSSTILEKVAKQNLSLFNATNFVVKIYEKGVDSGLKPRLAAMLNYVGVQRMLIQKMVKELLLIENNIEPEVNKAYLKKTIFRFEHILTGLLEGDEELKIFGILEPETSKQLEIVKKLWIEYKPLLMKINLSEADLIKVAKINLILLEEMDKAVKMFEASMQ